MKSSGRCPCKEKGLRLKLHWFHGKPTPLRKASTETHKPTVAFRKQHVTTKAKIIYAGLVQVCYPQGHQGQEWGRWAPRMALHQQLYKNQKWLSCWKPTPRSDRAAHDRAAPKTKPYVSRLLFWLYEKNNKWCSRDLKECALLKNKWLVPFCWQKEAW